MTDVSATVVTLNEEENIRECLETLTWCDEIIIVDSYSDDATVEIAREYTDKIYTYERTGYSEPAREKALEEASGDWICMIDADERLPEKLTDQLQQIVSEDSADVVYAPRKNYIIGEWINGAGWWPDFRPVLYKKSVSRLSDEIHNFISFSERSKEVYLDKEENNAIVHFNYDGFRDFVSRMNRYTDIEGRKIDFSIHRMVSWPLFEFANRYFLEKGFLLGYRGFFLSILMSWYRVLGLIKAWQYERVGGDSEIRSHYESMDDL
jgi:glycosyltransferase involved in cell wall biosynthesis